MRLSVENCMNQPKSFCIALLIVLYASNVKGICYDINYLSCSYCCSNGYGTEYCCDKTDYEQQHTTCTWWLSNSPECSNPWKPYCCKKTSRCCTQLEYEAEQSQKCTQNADCDDTYKSYCCDSTATCCTYFEYKYTTCYFDSACRLDARPYCCQDTNKCCTKADYEEKNRACNSSSDCMSYEKPRCCDSTAKCCTQTSYDKETCYSDYECKLPSKTKCCQSTAKCCSPPPSNTPNTTGLTITDIGAITAAGMLSFIGLCVCIVFVCKKSSNEALVNNSLTDPTSTPPLPRAQIGLPQAPAYTPKPPPYTPRGEPPPYDAVCGREASTYS